jgi:hypothetical protein
LISPYTPEEVTPPGNWGELRIRSEDPGQVVPWSRSVDGPVLTTGIAARDGR